MKAKKYTKFMVQRYKEIRVSIVLLPPYFDCLMK